MPLAPNQQLFEYRIVRVLGQGAFGTVYLAHDTLPTEFRNKSGGELDLQVAQKMAASGAEIASFTPFLRLSGGQSNCTNPQELVQPIAKCGLPVPYPHIWG